MAPPGDSSATVGQVDGGDDGQRWVWQGGQSSQKETGEKGIGGSFLFELIFLRI